MKSVIKQLGCDGKTLRDAFLGNGTLTDAQCDQLIDRIENGNPNAFYILSIIRVSQATREDKRELLLWAREWTRDARSRYQG